MFELHGWFVLRSSPHTNDDETAERIAGKLRGRLAEIDDGGLHSELVGINGEYRLLLSGGFNRRRASFDQLMEILGWLGPNAEGTYGLLYYRDDEGHDGNQMGVWRLARGEMSHSIDTLLSPCVPTIEDP